MLPSYYRNYRTGSVSTEQKMKKGTIPLKMGIKGKIPIHFHCY